jgi:hypothetical protein
VFVKVQVVNPPFARCLARRRFNSQPRLPPRNAGTSGGRSAHFTSAAEVAAPQPNGVFTNAERLGDARTGPNPKTSTEWRVLARLSPITRPGQRHQGGALIPARGNRGLAAHAAPCRIKGDSESYTYSLVKVAESAFSSRPDLCEHGAVSFDRNCHQNGEGGGRRMSATSRRHRNAPPAAAINPSM